MTSASPLPEVREVRTRIEKIKHRDHRLALMYLYLIDGRVSEAVSKRAPRDTRTTPRGPTGKDIDFLSEGGEEVAVFHIRTSKRDGAPRVCAQPINPVYQPWTKPVADYLSNLGAEEPAFPWTRQKLWAVAEKVFTGLTYEIDGYTNIVYTRDENGTIARDSQGKPLIGRKENVERHPRQFRLHAIRHLVASDLVYSYGFNGMDLSQFGGWTLKTALGVSGSISRYLVLNWRQYLPKLPVRRVY